MEEGKSHLETFGLSLSPGLQHISREHPIVVRGMEIQMEPARVSPQ
jgi:hypothetical protein